jgi:chemotaxis protein histidine kinase CheA
MVAFKIIEAMNGKVKVKSEKNKGTRIIVRFPGIIRD